MEFGKHLGKGIWGLADKFLPVIYGLAYVLLVIRVLPEEEFGNFVLIQEIFLIVTGLATALALQPLLKFAAEEDSDRRGYISVAVLLSAVFYILSSAGILLLKDKISGVLHSPGLASLLFLLPWMFLAAFMRNLVLILLQSRFMIKEIFWTDTLHFLGVPVLIWAFSRAHIFNSAQDLIIINIISLSASSVVGFYLSRSLISFQLIPNITEVKRMWDYGKWALGSSISIFAVLKSDTFILAGFAGPLQVALYGSAKVFVRVFEMLTQVIQMFVLPAASKLASKNDFKSLRIMVEKATMFSMIGVIPIFLGFLILPSLFISILYKGKYLEAIPILQVFAFVAFAVPLSAVAGNALMGIGHARSVFIIGVELVLVALVSYLIFIPWLGSTGAAIGYVITGYASAFAAAWYLRKHVPLTVRDVLSRADDVVVFLKARIVFLRS